LLKFVGVTAEFGLKTALVLWGCPLEIVSWSWGLADMGLAVSKMPSGEDSAICGVENIPDPLARRNALEPEPFIFLLLSLASASGALTESPPEAEEASGLEGSAEVVASSGDLVAAVDCGWRGIMI